MERLKPEFEHEDERRRLTQVFTAKTRQVNLYNAKRGAVLGDHYHEVTREFFLLTRGQLLYNDKDIFVAGQAFVVEPGENHKITCLTDVTLVSFLTEPFDPEKPDICKN